MQLSILMASLPCFLRESLSEPEVHHFSRIGWQWAPGTACSVHCGGDESVHCYVWLSTRVLGI